MKNIQLLDCTLRDGGYVNDWLFGYKEIKGIISRLVESQVEYVEVGFLRDCEYNLNASLFNNISEIKNVIPEMHGKTKFTVMALHNRYSIDKLEDNDGTAIDAIRVTFHDYDIDEGLEFVKNIIKKGYKCFCNPINIMGYSDKAILEMIDKVNKIKPFSFSIVDTFGSMMINDLIRIYSIVENNLDKDISIGLHLHENQSMSFALVQKFLEICSNSRNGIVDGSLLGMGRAPGNLCIELIMDYLNNFRDYCYNVNSVLDGIDDFILPIKKNESWGYTTAYSLSAKYNLHRNYGEFLLKKGRLRAKQINQILSHISDEKKSVYDEAYIEGLYSDFQNIEIDDNLVKKELSTLFNNRNILVLAPGYSIVEHKNIINEFIKLNDPIIIATNFDGLDYNPDFYFFTNLRRFENNKKLEHSENIIATSNMLRGGVTFKYMVNYIDLVFQKSKVFDNSIVMLIRLLQGLGIAKVNIAGFDGFQESRENYFEKNYQFYFMEPKRDNDEENKKIRESIQDLRYNISLNFITPSLHD